MDITTPSVNLLKGRKRLLKQQRLVIAKVQFVATLVLLVYLVLIVAVVLIRFLLQANLDTVERTIDSELLAIAQLRPVEEAHTLMVEKTKLVADFLAVKANAKTAVRTVRDSLPEAVQISSIVFVDSGQISVALEAESVFSLRNYLDLVQKQVSEATFQQIFLSGLARTADGSWRVESEYYFE